MITFASRAERIAYRRANLRCDACGVRLDPGEPRLCERCKKMAAKRQKAYRAKLPDKGYGRVKADRAKHPEKWKARRIAAYHDARTAKKCTKCSLPAFHGSLCKKHNKKSARYSLRYYRKKGRERRRQRARAA